MQGSHESRTEMKGYEEGEAKEGQMWEQLVGSATIDRQGGLGWGLVWDRELNELGKWEMGVESSRPDKNLIAEWWIKSQWDWYLARVTRNTEKEGRDGDRCAVTSLLCDTQYKFQDCFNYKQNRNYIAFYFESLYMNVIHGINFTSIKLKREEKKWYRILQRLKTFTSDKL